MKALRVVNKSKFYSFLLILSILIFVSTFMLLSFISSNLAYGADVEEYMTVTVHDGDTIWTIAEPIAVSSNRDIRDVVKDIRSLNNLECVIYPGQTLQIPNI